MKRPDRDRDAGIGLIELIVAIVISGLILAGIATILARSWLTQESVTSVTQATTRGQLVSAAIERAVRNALYIQVSDSGRLLQVSTSLSGNLKCQGFRLSGDSGGSARFATDSTSLDAWSTWPIWEEGISVQGTAPFFDDSVAGVISYSFQIATESAPVKFSGDVLPRSIQEGDNDSCWS
jgi:Tfp pilus assembly protein PilE